MRKVEIQHGDVLWDLVDSIPEGAKKIKLPRDIFVVEKGEGIHTHTLVAERPDLVPLFDLVDVFEKDGTLYVRPKEGGTVTTDHEEHGKRVMFPGKIYRKESRQGIEREFDYEKEVERKTID